MWQGVSVVIPVYNSSNSLEELYQRLSSLLKKISDVYEIIMVDDGSSDQSYERILSICNKDHRVKAIRLDRNYGQQNALLCGFNFVNCQYIITLDDDLQHQPEEIEILLLTLDKGYDIVFGIPGYRNHQFYRKVGSKLTNYLFQLITDKPPGLRISSFRAIRKELIDKIITHDQSFIYISASAFKFTINAANVETNHSSRVYGSSNYNFYKLFKLFLKLFIYHSRLPFLRVFRSSCPPFRIKDSRVIKQ